LQHINKHVSSFEAVCEVSSSGTVEIGAGHSSSREEHFGINPEIIRNRFKIYATRQNAAVFLKIQKEYGSFDAYIWNFVQHKPIINYWQTLKDIPQKTATSDALSKDLKKRGMVFVGSTIIYAYMQAIGMVNDHIAGCWLRMVDY